MSDYISMADIPLLEPVPCEIPHHLKRKKKKAQGLTLGWGQACLASEQGPFRNDGLKISRPQLFLP